MRRSRTSNQTSIHSVLAIATACGAALFLCAAPAGAQGMNDWTLQAPHHRAPPPPPEPPEVEPPRAGTSRWELAPGVSASLYDTHSDSLQDAHGNEGSGWLGARIFFEPVVDDGAVRSLQPFLQRASSFYVGVSGGGFTTVRGAETRSNRYFSVDTSVNAYVNRWVALTAGFGYGYSVLSDLVVNKTHGLTASGGLGIRVGDARLDATYGFAAHATDGTFEKPRWGNFTLGIFVVFLKRVTARGFGRLLDRGGTAGIDLGYYPSRDLGLFLGGFGGGGHLYSDDVLVTRGGGSAGLSYWLSSRFRLGPTYYATYNNVRSELGPFGYWSLDHALAIDGVIRLP